MNRRTFINQSLIATAGIGVGGFGINHQLMGSLLTTSLVPEMDFFEFKIGNFDCMSICDQLMSIDKKMCFYGASDERIDSILEEYGIIPNEDGTILAVHSSFLINTGTNLVLIDTGTGNGKLIEILKKKGVSPEDIDSVVFTHGHWDHIGGNVDKDGNMVFPNARFYMSKADYDFWTNESYLNQIEGKSGEYAKKNLLPLKERIDLIELNTEFIPGLTALNASGHTPGQIAVEIESKGEKLIHLGDTIHHLIHNEYPEWRVDGIDIHAENGKVVYEYMSAPARKRFAQRAFEQNAQVFFSHVYPIKPGKIVRKGDGFAFTHKIE